MMFSLLGMFCEVSLCSILIFRESLKHSKSKDSPQIINEKSFNVRIGNSDCNLETLTFPWSHSLIL